MENAAYVKVSNKHLLRTYYVGWGCSSVVEHLPNTHEVLGSIPTTEKGGIKKEHIYVKCCYMLLEIKS
jgi:hypothetical protein